MILHEKLKQFQHITEMEFLLCEVVITIILKNLEDEQIFLRIFLLIQLHWDDLMKLKEEFLGLWIWA